MKQLVYIACCMALVACNATDENSVADNDTELQQQNDTIVDKKELVEIKGNQYTEYYPDKKTIKFQGEQDDEGQRHGKWVFYGENGLEQSMTFYQHGLKHGHSIVKYPNGGIRYMGEYENNKQVGIWKSYAQDGSLTEEKDYGYPEE